MRPSLTHRALAEGLGTFALVFIGCGAVIANAQYGGSVGLVGIALAFGLVVMAMIYAIGHLSGAHINPAVTIAFVATRHVPVREALGYVAAQLLGGVTAGLLLLVLWPAKPGGLGATLPHASIGTAVVYELVTSALLMFVVMAVATDTRAVGAAAAIAIGGTVALDIIAAGEVSGGSMNPARSLGPALASGHLQDLWIYFVGPIGGALLGAIAYEVLRGRRASDLVEGQEETA